MKVLIPVQDDVFGDVITDVIAQHGWFADTEFKLMTVIEYSVYGEMLGEVYCCERMRGIYIEHQAAAQKLLDDYSQKLDKAMPGVMIRRAILFGQPRDMILQEAEKWGADMIVMGSHARRGLSRFLLGSVASSVLSQAPCSVIIVKLPRGQQTTTSSDAAHRACRLAV